MERKANIQIPDAAVLVFSPKSFTEIEARGAT